MNDKQAKAIERCKELIKEEHSCWIGISNQKAITIVLDLLKETTAELQQKSVENAELKEINAEHKKQMGEMEKELSKKEKIINLMATSINSYDAQLEINTFKDSKDVKDRFEELYEELKNEEVKI